MQKILISKRRGVSLLNVMVFMVFAVILTAQVFFFAKNAVDEVADEREMMMYRMNLDSLVQEAMEALRKGKEAAHKDKIINKYIKKSNSDVDFYDGTNVWSNTNNTVRIHDLDYKFDPIFFTTFNRNTDWKEQSGENMYKKIFAAMPFIPKKKIKTDDDGNTVTDAEGNPEYEYTDDAEYRYYLIRAWVQLPENFYGSKLMYQVLVRRKEDDHTDLKVRSFQEVWF